MNGVESKSYSTFDVGIVIKINYKSPDDEKHDYSLYEEQPISYLVELTTRHEIIQNVQPLGLGLDHDDIEVYTVGTPVLVLYIQGVPYVLQKIGYYPHSMRQIKRQIVDVEEGEKVSSTKYGGMIRKRSDGGITVEGKSMDSVSGSETRSSIDLGGEQGYDAHTNQKIDYKIMSGKTETIVDEKGNWLLRAIRGFFIGDDFRISVLKRIRLVATSLVGRIEAIAEGGIILRAGKVFHLFAGSVLERAPKQFRNIFVKFDVGAEIEGSGDDSELNIEARKMRLGYTDEFKNTQYNVVLGKGEDTPDTTNAFFDWLKQELEILIPLFEAGNFGNLGAPIIAIRQLGDFFKKLKAKLPDDFVSNEVTVKRKRGE